MVLIIDASQWEYKEWTKGVPTVWKVIEYKNRWREKHVLHVKKDTEEYIFYI